MLFVDKIKTHTPSEIKNTWWIALFGILCCLWLLVQLHSFLYLCPTIEWLQKVNNENKLRYGTFYEDKYSELYISI